MVIIEKLENTHKHKEKKSIHLKFHNPVINTINFLVSFLIDFISHNIHICTDTLIQKYNYVRLLFTYPRNKFGDQFYFIHLAKFHNIRLH